MVLLILSIFLIELFLSPFSNNSPHGHVVTGKLLGNPGLQGQHAYLVVRTNKKKTSIKNLMT